MAFTATSTPILNKIKVGDQIYYLADADARALLEQLKEGAFRDQATEVKAGDTGFVTGAQVAEAIKELNGAMHFVDASAEGYTPTAGDVKIDGTKEYVYDGSKWVELGDEGLWVTKNLTIAGIDLQDNITVAELQEALGLGDMAYADSASGTVTTMDSVVMKEITVSGEIEIGTTATEIESTGKFTPAGNVTGKAIKGGSIEVTLKDAEQATEASLTKGDYTPAGDVTVSAKAGTAAKTVVTGLKDTTTKVATFSEGEFTPASIGDGFVTAGTDASLSAGAAADLSTKEISYVESGVEVSIDTTDAEMLVFTNLTAKKADVVDEFTPNTLQTLTGGKATVIDTTKFNGGAKAADTFTATFVKDVDTTDIVDAGDIEATFAGTKAQNVLVTKVEYTKQDVDTKTFTPVAATLGFAGTEGNVTVAGEYDKADGTAEFSDTFTPEVETYNKTAKTVTVTPVAKA